MALGLLLVASGAAVSVCYAGEAEGQLQQAAENSSHAAGSTSEEQARDEAGYSFDNSNSVAPPVDLSGAGSNPTPTLLRNPDGSNPYAPKLGPNKVPPPLP